MDDARRTHVVADHRRRPVDRERADVQLGRSTPAAAHRYLSFDKASGRANWISSPEGRPTDTIYANPYVADVNGVRMFFSGGSDGAMHALKVDTGEKVWSWPVSQRGLNTAALLIGPDVIVSHSEENLARARWACSRRCPPQQERHAHRQGRALAHSRRAGGLRVARVSDGQRIYIVDNGGILFATTPRRASSCGSRTSARSRNRRRCSPTASSTSAPRTGSSTSSGRSPTKPKSSIRIWLGSEQNPEPIIASPAVARGRVYVVSMNAIYAIGPKMAPPGAPANPATAAKPAAAAQLPAGVPPRARDAHRTHPQARRVDRFDRRGLRRQRRRHLPAAPATWTVEEPQGHGRRRQVHRRRRRRSAGRPGQGHSRDASSARRASASSPICRGASTSRTGAKCRRRTGRTPPASSPCATSTAAKSSSSSPRIRFAFAKRCRPFFGVTELTRLHHRVGRPRDGAPPPDGRHRHRRAALRAGAVRQPPGAHLQPWQPETSAHREESTSSGTRTPGTR